MSFDDQPEPSLEVIDVAHADGFSHQSRYAVAPFVVQSFNDAGFAAPFGAWPMLPGREPFGIDFIEVAVNEFAPIISRQRKPQADETFGAAVADIKADNLSCHTGDRQP